ncbi:MAG: opgG [Hyphomicrobiales bacterium]|nr:opgG [Hyphomicrobiales bacterium]
MYKRRDLLKLAASTAAVATSVVGPVRIAQAQTPPTPPTPPAGDAPRPADPAAFDPAAVVDFARALSKRPYKAPVSSLVDPFASLTYDLYVGIKNKPESLIWPNDNVGFAIEPLHRGFIFSAPMDITIVENGVARKLVYSPDQFDFGRLAVPPNLGDIGFSGFRVLLPRDGGFSDVAIFQGASFFRARARGQNFGTVARGLSIRTADPRGEEFPAFRSVWIEKPTISGNALVIHAILDSESVTGAYRFTLRPGEATIIDTECTLFARTAVDNVGIATMAGTCVFGPLDRRRDDIRPAVHEISGLQILNGNGEWLWRPVSNRETLQVSAFIDTNPRGFGFLQRERDFDRFQDDNQHWELRPSLWIEPIGDWGPGDVALVEIPSESEVNDNMVAYWRPKQGLAAGSETYFAYRQFWCWTPPDRPSLAFVAGSRSGRPPGAQSGARRRRFLVDFSGDIFADPQRSAEVTPNLNASPGAISSVRTFLNRERKSLRVLFDMDAGNETLSELRLVLEAQGKPVSETWLYRWTP